MQQEPHIYFIRPDFVMLTAYTKMSISYFKNLVFFIAQTKTASFQSINPFLHVYSC